MFCINHAAKLVQLGMDTMTSEEKVIGHGPIHQVDASIIHTGIVENQMEKDMKIVDNFTVMEDGTTLVVRQDLHLFVNMDPDPRSFVNIVDIITDLNTTGTHLLSMESNMKLSKRK